MGMIATKNCILCLKPATSFSGHLLLKATVLDGLIESVMAGWCNKHYQMPSMTPDFAGKEGCVGYYGDLYGIEHKED